MRSFVKSMFFVFTLCLCASLCDGTETQAKIKRGKWKDNVSWTYDTKTKEFVIRGSGKIAESYETEYGMDAPEWDMISSDIKSMRIEGKITRVSDYFSGISGLPNMTSLKLSKHIKQIGQGAFRSSAKLKSVKLKNGLKRIQKDAFANSGLREISIPKSVKKIEDSVFRGCDKLKKVSFAEGVEKTGQLMFWGCNNLKKVELPKSLKVIERSCFLATGLERITIPENVEEIGDLSFAQSSTKKAKLKEVTIKSKKITKWGKDIFEDAHRDLVIHVPASKKLQYELALRAKGLPTYVKVVGETSLD